MKVLFVDDETRILSGIENALLFDYDEWDVKFANSGASAIEHLDESAYDVLVTDMQMPGLSGADVLEHAKHSNPDMVRIVLSGEVNEELARRAMSLTHEFVSKPCDPETLFTIIQHVYDTSRSLTAANGVGVLGILDQLPSQPDLYLRVQEAVHNRASTDEIAQLIEADLSIATSIIRTANSSFYGFRHPAEEVRDAVSRLGSKTLTGLLLQAELTTWVTPAVAGVVGKLNATGARRSHVVTALVSEHAGHAGQAGLLCDVGVLALLTVFPENARDLRAVVSDGGQAAEHERDLFGATHAEVGSAMLEMWNFAPTVVDAVRHHHHHIDASGPAIAITEALTAIDIAERAAAGQSVDPEGLNDDLLAQAFELWEQAAEQ